MIQRILTDLFRQFGRDAINGAPAAYSAAKDMWDDRHDERFRKYRRRRQGELDRIAYARMSTPERSAFNQRPRPNQSRFETLMEWSPETSKSYHGAAEFLDKRAWDAMGPEMRTRIQKERDAKRTDAQQAEVERELALQAKAAGSSISVFREYFFRDIEGAHDWKRESEACFADIIGRLPLLRRAGLPHWTPYQGPPGRAGQ